MKNVIIIFLVFCCLLTMEAQISITKISDSPYKVSNNAVCEGFINDVPYIFSFGGIDSSKLYSGIHLNSYRYNIATGETLQLPDLPDNRGKIAAGASRIGNYIYIAGGYHVYADHSELSSKKMHRYDIINNEFLADGEPIPIPTDDHVQVVWNDSLIYLISGWSNSGNIPSVQIYNPSEDSWEIGEATPNNHNYKSFGASGYIIDNTVYYFGGATSSGSFGIQNKLRKGIIDPNNPTSIEWSISTPDADINGYRMACTSVGDNVFWIGGSNTTYNYNGIAYNGTGGVPTSNSIILLNKEELTLEANHYTDLPMDLRGIASISDTVKYLLGGMIDDQMVTNNIYKITFDPSFVGTNSFEDRSDELILYPNPFIDKINIKEEIDLTGAILNIFDMLGTKMYTKKMSSNDVIQLENLTPGVYFLIINHNNSIYSRKILKTQK